MKRKEEKLEGREEESRNEKGEMEEKVEGREVRGKRGKIGRQRGRKWG